MKPILQALVLADHVYQDKSSGKIIVAGIFSNLSIARKAHSPEANLNEGPRVIDASEFIRAGSPSCYINLASIRGTLPLELRYVDLADNSLVMTIGFTVVNDDPLRNVEIIVPVPPLPTPHVGAYVLELLSNDELIGSHRISVIERALKESE